MRVLIKQGRACNNDCTFCHASDRTHGADPIGRIADKIAAAREVGAHTVVLSGGEPTVRAELLGLADMVRDAGLRLGLVTNGRRLADLSLVDALVARGLDYAYVSLHGSAPAIHDPLVGAPAFDQTLAGIRNLHGRVATLSVNTVVTPANLGDLRNIVDLLAPMPSLSHKFTMPQPKGAAWDRFDQVVPTLVQAADAVANAIRHGLAAQPRPPRSRFGFEGLPLCLLPGLDDLLSDLRSHDILWMSEPEDERLEPVDDTLLTKPRRCDGCLLRRSCPGIYVGYADRRGDSELKPVLRDPDTTATASSDGAHDTREESAGAAGSVPAARALRLDLADDVRPADAASAREAAAHEQRAWVRLTYACNNRCLFCLDRGSGRSERRPSADVRREILDGRTRGADRLILSGGEATTHPDFADLVAFGKSCGYRWVQCVSNGRMFAYPKFVARAISAGLDEITVSMHGHTPELHDRLVGVPGAFEQASRGVRTALRSGRLVVNIDVVINALNVDHLPAMLETFVGWGVHEFDLLHIIPFGGAWEPDNRHLFYDPAQHMEALRAALEFSMRPGIHLWLNRFPPAHAEGFEALIQDPYKLHDEIRGRAQEFREYLSGGAPLDCREPDRCARCYLRGTCDSLDRTFAMARLPQVEHVRARLPLGDRSALPPSDLLELHAPSANLIVQLLGRVQATRLRLRLDDVGSLRGVLASDGTIRGVAVECIVLGSPAAIEAALALPGTFDLVVELDVHTAPIVQTMGDHAHRLVLTQPARDLLSACLDFDVDLRSLFASLPFAVRTEDIAPCLSGIVPQPHVEALDMESFDEHGQLDAQRFIGVYVRHGFMTKSLRCSSCPMTATCRGMHVNWVRAHGYASMRPDACERLATRIGQEPGERGRGAQS